LVRWHSASTIWALARVFQRTIREVQAREQKQLAGSELRRD
jgi:hypothetical protein